MLNLATRSFFILLLLPALAFAQTATELDALLETGAVTAKTAARFTLGAAGLTPPELSGAAAEKAAYEAALGNGWVKSGPDDAISLQEAAFLMMNVFKLKGGVMYTIFKSPRYAYREMLYQKLIPGRADAKMFLSGVWFLQILGKALNFSGERAEMDAILASRGGQN